MSSGQLEVYRNIKIIIGSQIATDVFESTHEKPKHKPGPIDIWLWTHKNQANLLPPNKKSLPPQKKNFMAYLSPVFAINFR